MNIDQLKDALEQIHEIAGRARLEHAPRAGRTEALLSACQSIDIIALSAAHNIEWDGSFADSSKAWIARQAN